MYKLRCAVQNININKFLFFVTVNWCNTKWWKHTQADETKQCEENKNQSFIMQTIHSTLIYKTSIFRMSLITIKNKTGKEKNKWIENSKLWLQIKIIENILFKIPRTHTYSVCLSIFKSKTYSFFFLPIKWNYPKLILISAIESTSLFFSAFKTNDSRLFPARKKFHTIQQHAQHIEFSREKEREIYSFSVRSICAIQSGTDLIWFARQSFENGIQICDSLYEPCERRCLNELVFVVRKELHTKQVFTKSMQMLSTFAAHFLFFVFLLKNGKSSAKITKFWFSKSSNIKLKNKNVVKSKRFLDFCSRKKN